MKRKKTSGTLVKQKVIFHLFFSFHPAAIRLSGNVEKKRRQRRRGSKKCPEAHAAIERVSQDWFWYQKRASASVDYTQRTVFIIFCFVCWECRVFSCIRWGRKKEQKRSGQIEINFVLFPSNRLTSEIVLVDLSKTWGKEKEGWRKKPRGV